MAFPKFHGITLAANSFIENMRLERLAADPTALVAPGRFWFNDTEKLVKFTTLDAGGVVVVRSIQDVEAASLALSNLQTTLQAEINAGGAGLQTEINNRTAAVAALTAALADETAARIAGDAAEATARTAAIAVAAANAADATATEAAARLAGDAAVNTRVDAVQAELNATQAGAGLDSDGNFVAPLNSSFLGDSTSLAESTVLLDAALTTEAATRLGQIAAVQSALANEAQSRADGDAALEARITAYVNAELTADETQDAAEVQNRIDGDARIQAELDQTQASIGLDADGKLIPITGTNYMDGSTTVFGAAVQLDINIGRVDTALAGEVAARTAADTAATAALQAEITARTTAVTGVQAEIDATQVGAGLEADGSFVAPTGSNYLNSATSLKDASLVLDSALAAEAARAVAAEAALRGDVAAIQAASGEGAAALKSAINASRFTFRSTVGSLSHVIAHGLNAEFTEWTVMVEGDDGKFRNDIVPVEEVDANTLRVDLSEPRNIKIVVRNGAALA